MALPPEKAARMDAAADEFDKELRAVYDGFTPEQKDAVNKVVDLINDYYTTAAYDRICRKMRALRPTRSGTPYRVGDRLLTKEEFLLADEIEE